MATSDNESLDALFHALADSTRRVILEDLAKRDNQPLFEICVRTMEDHGMNLSRQAVSKHLRVLEDAGLVEVRWEGRTKLHSSTLSLHLSQLIKWLQNHQ